MRYPRGFRLSNERVYDLRWYFTESASLVPIPSANLNSDGGGASTDPGRLLALERFVLGGRLAEGRRRIQVIGAVLEALRAKRPATASATWRCLSIAYGRADAAPEFGDIYPLMAHTPIALERGAKVWPRWSKAQEPWDKSPGARETKRRLAGTSLPAHAEVVRAEFLPRAVAEVVARALSHTSRDETARRFIASMAAQAEKMLSEASRELGEAWDELADREKAARAGDVGAFGRTTMRGRVKIRAASRLTENEPLPQTNEERVEVLERLIGQMRGSRGATT